ncbi:hypothetical protein DY000_02002983 [Brassica cretica]|uniref:Uncharacterized protein n=1 Tax=Brassica cretica TaxID=69181 RepID=A0ABQ7CEA7_BRACR|nr:hypothetical protein DY000_02002983 [Brassica cretica]
MQYRVVEKSRLSSGSSAPHRNTSYRLPVGKTVGNPQPRQTESQNDLCLDTTPARDLRNRLITPVAVETDPNLASRLEVTPARNLQARIEIPLPNREESHSG